MSGFVNTIDLLGDEVVTKAIIEKTLTEFNDDQLNAIGWYGLRFMNVMTKCDFPNVQRIEASGVGDNAVLESIRLLSCTSLGMYALKNCPRLKTIILGTGSICRLYRDDTLDGTPFASGGTGGTLIVPRAFTTEYPNATNWSAVIARNANNRVLALEDYTIDGTITGEIDWDKLNGGN